MAQPAKKSSGGTLQDIMNTMAGRPDSAAADASAERAAVRGVLSEADAYARIDPLLAGLLKQYRDTQARHEQLLRANGACDPMTEVAADLAESCDSAVQTRMIELREQIVMRQAAEELMRDSLESEKASARYNKKLDLHAREIAADNDLCKKEARESYMFVLFLWWMLQEALFATQIKLSAAHAFAQASDHDRRLIAV